ncbi:MAG: CBS domain-containing protein [Bacteroidota bacterium]
MNPLLRVNQIMSTELVTVMPNTPLGLAKELFEKHKIHHLPVVSPEGDLQGMISKSDFLKLLEIDDDSRAGLCVGDLMTAGLAKLETDDSVRTAANIFALNRFHALPVVDGSKLVGVLTTQDLIQLLDNEKVELTDYQA